MSPTRSCSSPLFSDGVLPGSLMFTFRACIHIGQTPILYSFTLYLSVTCLFTLWYRAKCNDTITFNISSCLAYVCINKLVLHLIISYLLQYNNTWQPMACELYSMGNTSLVLHPQYVAKGSPQSSCGHGHRFTTEFITDSPLNSSKIHH